MATVSTNAFYGTPASSTTQNIPRYVEDQVRDMFPESAKLLALVAKGQVSRGKYTEQAGMIPKKSIDNPRFECYSYTPLAVSITTTGLSSTTLTVSDSSNLTATMCLFNSANGTTARIDSITNSTTVEVTSFGTTAFAVTSGDTLIVLAPVREEGSISPLSIWKNEDNIYNMTSIMRFPVSISDTARRSPSYFGDYWERMKKVNFIEAKRKAEYSMLFSNRPSSGNTTSGGAAYTGSFSSTRGLWQWAGSTFSAGGAMTADMFRREIPSYIAANTANIVGEQSPMVMFCGNEVAGRMMQWVNQVQRIDNAGGEETVFGLRAKSFMTSTYTVKVITHEVFNKGSLANQALLFNPEELFYAFLRNRDLQVRTNIQNPSADGYTDELYGEIGLGVRDGGQSIVRISNWY